jgi:serine/threonine protein kinase
MSEQQVHPARLPFAFRVPQKTFIRGLVVRSDYQLIKILHQSDFAEISLVTQNGTNYIFKTFNAPFTTGILQLLFSECYYVIESMSHPVLLDPVSFCFSDTHCTYHPSFVYPWIPSAKPLTEFLASPDRLTLDNRQMIVLGVLHALFCLHHNNFVHGNLNSDNVLIDDDLLPHLISRGLHKIADQFYTAVRGMPEFLAPEVLAGGPRSQDSDVFAFGKLLHAVFADTDLPGCVKIREVAEACSATDPNDRPHISVLGGEPQWLGFVSDDVIADLEAMNAGRDQVSPTRHGEGETSTGPDAEPGPTESHRPFFSGEAHNDYSRHKKQLEVIFTAHFPRWDETSYERCILPLAEIPAATIYYWKGKWEANQSWRPWDTKVHGLHHRKFDDGEEASIKQTILRDYVEAGQMFTEVTFKIVTFDAWKNFGRDPTKFHCSKKFINGFKERNGFSSRRFHTRRRNRLASEEEIKAWTDAIRKLLADNAERLNMIVNCDETAWRIIPSGLVTWAPVGADSVSVEVNANEKDSVTVLASVTAAGEKLQLFAVAQGKTKQVEETQIGGDGSVIRDHSESDGAPSRLFGTTSNGWPTTTRLKWPRDIRSTLFSTSSPRIVLKESRRMRNVSGYNSGLFPLAIPTNSSRSIVLSSEP